MKIVALLPMKANSERVKGKNFKTFGGKPLFRWMLDNLVAIPAIDQVIINTDARERIEDIGFNGADKVLIRDRRKDICGDYVSMNTIIEDDVNNVEATIYLMTHTTNPLLTRVSIERAISKFKDAILNDEADSLFTVNKVQERFYNGEAQPLNHDPNNLIRTQDLVPWYQENSNLYLFTKDSFIASGARIGRRPMMLETDPYESTDIDTPDDWDLGEIVLEYYRKKRLL